MSKKQDILFNRRAHRVANNIRRYLKNKGMWRYGDKNDFSTLFKLFIEHSKIEVEYNGYKDLKKWAVDLYVNGSVEGISKVDGGFYGTPEWKQLRKKVIAHYGYHCMKCGDVSGGAHVDHIKPRSKFPELQLEFSNLQVLCLVCNIRKSNRSYEDYRPSGLVLAAGLVPKVDPKKKDFSYMYKGLSKRDRELQLRYDKHRPS